MDSNNGMMVTVFAAAVTLAVLGNTIVYLIVTGPLGEPLIMCSSCSDPTPELTPMSIGDPILFSALFGTGAVIIYAAIQAIARRPLRVFLLVATPLLALSLILPGIIPSPPVEWSAKLALTAMHVTGYGVIVGTLLLGHKLDWLGNRSSPAGLRPS